MTTPSTNPHPPLLRQNPLVPAAALFLAGIALAPHCQLPVPLTMILAATLLLAWLLAELTLTARLRLIITHLTLSLSLLLVGLCLFTLNQTHVEPTHLVRFLDSADPLPLTAHLRVLTPPEASTSHGNLYFLATLTDIFTDQGTLPSAGDVRIKWRQSPANPELHRGDLIEIHGWAQRPPTALNPGALDLRQLLAADRIFAEIRIPRVSGLTILESANTAPGPNPLTRLRLLLKSKLLEHTTRVDPEAAYSMVALLLGHRDLVIDNVSQAFADAGVAHLLAISGFHVAFFAVLVWSLLCFLPIRPRLRDSLIALIVLVYVLATPCGPPVIRAAIALLMVLIARLLARPRIFLNMLATAAILIVLLRPSDLFTAGFQLSFLCTAALILLAPRLHAGLFASGLERQRIFANLSGSRWPRLKFLAFQSLAGFLTASIIGATAAAPLVAYHFGRLNPYALLTGLLAMPFVALTMAASALQLLLELLSTNLADHAAPITTAIAHLMVWLVTHLAALPASAIPLRAPPPWLIALLYAPFILWALRRRLGLTRAFILNFGLAILVAATSWYTLTQPRNGLRLTALSVGQGSSLLLRTPDSQLMLINAGSRDISNLVDHALTPTLRLAGSDRLDALLLTSLNTVTAQSAAPAIEKFHPPTLFTSPAEWQNRGFTRAGTSVEEALANTSSQQLTLTAGDSLPLGPNAHLHVLHPLPNSPPSANSSLILLLKFANRRILLLDPSAVDALALIQLTPDPIHADLAILLAPQRSLAADAPLRKALLTTGAQKIIWSGRTSWSPPHPEPNELNTADHSVEITITSHGQLTLNASPP